MDVTSTPAPTSLTTRRTGYLFKPGVLDRHDLFRTYLGPWPLVHRLIDALTGILGIGTAADTRGSTKGLYSEKVMSVAKHVSRFPEERPGEALIDWEERELRKKAKKLGIKPDPVKKKRRLD